MSFTTLGLSAPILQAVAEQGYSEPSPIQAQAIPAVLEGRDVMAAAQTGTGKTAGFTLPILEILARGERAKPNQARALILTPTRELAAQVGASVATYGEYLPLRSAVVFGGVKINPQMMKLRNGVDILVATPGRLLDLYQQNAVRFNHLEVLVLDEADRMLDMGFIHDIRKIINYLPKQRQNLMFSATFSNDIRQLAKGIVNNPAEISVSPANTTANSVEQWVYPTDKKKKAGLLAELTRKNGWDQVLVFTKTKRGANQLTTFLESEGITALAIHGNKSQGARTKALANFKDGKVRVLVATDIAARGLDIDQLPQVVNFELPNVPEDYVHRIGRTGRAGATGHAISLVCADEADLLFDIERLIKRNLDRKLVEGFEPVRDIGESRPLRPHGRSNKPKKPKKPRPTERLAEQGNSRAPKNSGTAEQKNNRHNQRRKASGNSTGGAAADGTGKPFSKRGKPSAKPGNKPPAKPNNSRKPASTIKAGPYANLKK
ncbi:DEAD/DEAH box helicase [Ketobacter sp. MCCC 1A13808]|uniref:DEAD/DEAH box helicase n=1 Tax=Ketobacter sp. MCCC 1A13808 TaxID=2602738 RepID=UPI000F1B19A2|nr:DEAD/DEAH box helicase [Ketobacter sp. MCCC 1A13808]MVF13730.1 DEAD/DEAH box helicase [Ketobacter sp. MCCC 1A13808]RLP52357.1 MAG: DEAD/DEAH box helicase [Ketobacter sp.]